ncbi:hypothetical protein PVMG_05138 [Plasmodium vivax Mauritania I]|uniref:Uncharacterized protein n=1 Tax=Plasmodium vivax Mauritania I TaxID=1035515 RepID=A0A0J9THU3_PLAVI|nr:hypothetical protein PVMG_05138 [Plasmodium vivax Mauritania I]
MLIFNISYCYYIKYIIKYWGYSYNVKYDYVEKFPEFFSEFPENKIAHGKEKYNDCETFYRSKLDIFNQKQKEFTYTCTNIVNYLDTIKEDVSSKSELCNYVNFWFYDKLKTDKKSSYLTLFDEFYTKITGLKACNTYNRIIIANTHQEIKYLFGLYYHFKLFKEESAIQDKKNCKNGKYCVQLYNKKLESCQEDYNNDVCKKLINFKYEYDDHIAKMKGCRDEIEYLKPIKNDLASIISFSFVLMTSVTSILLLLYKVNNKTVLNNL